MTTTAQPFEVLEVLGQGAFGTVCVARLRADPLRRIIAIKVIKREYASNAKIINRTRDEARLLLRLQHPNIVRVEQLLEVDGRPVVVMELVRGLDLKHLVRRCPNGLPPAVSLEIIRRTALALHAAYFDAIDDDGEPLRVIHRDIKTSNLLLSVHGQLKVVDFGIATGQFGDRESMTDSLVMGSRAYMAPERLDGRPDTPAVDVYGAGMCLYELLTGRVMGLSINPTSHDRTLARHLEAMDLPSIQGRTLDDLRRLLQRMCLYDAELRPTAKDAATELERLLNEIPAQANVSLDTFARDVVQKYYDERRRLPLHKALEAVEDAELLMAAALPGHSPQPFTMPQKGVRKGPAIFIGAILGTILMLSVLNIQRYMLRENNQSVYTVANLATVHFWFPSNARVRIGSLSLSVPGALELPPGRQEIDIVFHDGPTMVCSFMAHQDTAVRVVYDLDKPAISVNDGPAKPCRMLPGLTAP